MMSHLIPVILASLSVAAPPDPGAEVEVPRYGIFEQSLRHSGDRANPYATLAATAELTAPDGVAKRQIPLFWDGGRDWKLRFSPDRSGAWSWAVRSDDPGLDGQSGRFRVVESDRKGGLGRMEGFPYHFRRQDGTPFWFLGDTGWALFTAGAEEKHTRRAVERYIDARAGQGFNVIHAMLISEAGWGNDGGPAFEDLGAERINPGYWREVDRTLAYLNGKGIVGGLVLAWSDKGRNPNNWRDFPSQEARGRYARYVAARYSAHDVYFIVGGEWDLEIKRSGLSRDELKRQYMAIGAAVAAADPHGRLIGIHPGGNGSVEEFADAPGMDFGDYQQIYNDLHAAILKARDHDRPVVNAEYAYYLRDQDEDGRTDKPNSTSLEAIRHASWDIAMAGGYLVTGFGTTYFGGNRHPGPFDVDTAKNDDWEEDVQHLRTLFTSPEWWRLEPHDELITAREPRGEDRAVELPRASRRSRVRIPPATTYWALADPGRAYVAYVRGLSGPTSISLGRGAGGQYRLRQFDPRTGRSEDLGTRKADDTIRYEAPDERDWVLVIEAVKP